MLIRLFLLLGALLLCAPYPASANHVEQQQQCAVLAQEWYDALDPNNEIGLSYAFLFDPRPTTQFRALQELQNALDRIYALDYPTCIRIARGWYLTGLNELIVAAENMLDGDTGNFILHNATAFQMIGQLRGYMAGIGVRINYIENATMYFH